MRRNLKLMLQREPAALGSLVASIIPVLVIFGVIPGIDEAGIAAVVVAVNTAIGFLIRVVVSPVSIPASAGGAAQEVSAA